MSKGNSQELHYYCYNTIIIFTYLYQQKLNVGHFVKLEFMAELLCWIAQVYLITRWLDENYSRRILK